MLGLFIGDFVNKKKSWEKNKCSMKNTYSEFSLGVEHIFEWAV